METGHHVKQSPTPPYLPVASAQSQDVSDILSDDALARLRRMYNRDPNQVAEASLRTIRGMYSESGDLLKEMMSEFYTRPSFARDREQIVIALLAARMGNRRMYLALHFYWGLMVGLSPEEIAHRLLFVSFYSGIDTLTSSLETLSVVLTQLKNLVNAARSDDALVPVAILGELKTWFP